VQIDAPVNYGSAGGAVIDIEGKCVAVVAHVRPDSPWSQNSGVAIAISSRSIRQIMARLEAGETITRPKRGYIGIRMRPGDPETLGVVVEQVQPDMPGDKAGIKKGDIITAVNGKEVADPADLARIVGGMKPGTKIELTILRPTGKDKTEQVTIELTLGVHPNS
jgi:serine protease Do